MRGLYDMRGDRQSRVGLTGQKVSAPGFFVVWPLATGVLVLHP
jgi:hypothetical protein